jgi:hypothetical protein
MPIFTKSYTHVWDENAPRCGLATPGGECNWAREPGLPWCNAHLCAFYCKLYTRGLRTESLPQIPLPAGLTMERFREAFGQYITHVEEMHRRQSAPGAKESRR